MKSDAPQLVRMSWGASEVLLCSSGRLKKQNELTTELLDELRDAYYASNEAADSALGPMKFDELIIGLSGVDSPGFNEDAVREDVVAPLLRKVGYRASGSMRMARGKPLTHPFVMIGSKKHKVSIIPDYILYEDSVPLLILDAKAPDEAVVHSKHVEQAYSYAIHPDVRCVNYALCNGRQLAFYHVSKSEPLFVIDCKEMLARWDEVQKYLLPRYLKMPELLEFAADFGLCVKELGVTREEEIGFRGLLLQQLTKSREGIYVANSSCTIGSLQCMATFDFGQSVLDIILKALPVHQATQVVNALSGLPCSIDLDAKVRVDWNAHLGEKLEGPYEEFIPMVVTKIVKVEYDPCLTIGAQDPAAVAARVPRLQV